MSAPRRKHQVSAAMFMPVVLLVLAALFAGCIQKRYTVYQFGYNQVGAEVLKEYEITPTVKASLK